VRLGVCVGLRVEAGEEGHPGRGLVRRCAAREHKKKASSKLTRLASLASARALALAALLDGGSPSAGEAAAAGAACLEIVLLRGCVVRRRRSARAVVGERLVCARSLRRTHLAVQAGGGQRVRGRVGGRGGHWDAVERCGVTRKEENATARPLARVLKGVRRV
jgi:hypothetical protein